MGALSAGAFLAVELGNNGTYQRLDTYTDADGDSTWHRATYVIDADQLSSAVTVRFIAQFSKFSSFFDLFAGRESTDDPKKVAIDNVVIVPAPGAVLLERNLTVESVTASPTPVASGDPVLLQVTLVNDGDATGSQSVRVYRHTARTTEPTAGTRVGSATTGSLAAGASVTKSIAVTAPTVSSETTYFYYVCTADHCSETPAEVVVRPESEPEQGPHLTVTSVAAIPTTVASGTLFTIRATITNDSTARSPSRTVTTYPSRSTTTTPTPYIRVGATATGSLAAGASVTKSMQITAPPVSSQTTYYYYVCVEDMCGNTPATVIVQPKPKTVAPTEIMGGSLLAVYFHADDVNYDVSTDQLYTSATLTLGGLTTTDGTKGAVVSGHSAVMNSRNIQSYKRTDALFFGDSRELIVKDLPPVFIGKVMRVPTPRQMGNFKNFFDADAAFVAYPSLAASNCSLTWREDETNTTFCLDLGHGEQIEPVTPLAIRGKKGAVYNVIGSQKQTKGLEVMFSGSRSGVAEGYKIKDDTPKLTGVTLGRVDGTGSVTYTYLFGGGRPSQGGDSGSPVYTIPDEDGNVHIVGILRGFTVIAGERFTAFNSWEDVEKELDLQPISP